MFYVYILLCGDNSFYTGHTDDLEKRLAMHTSGEYGGYTAQHLPVKVVYRESFPTREEALIAERGMKGWSRNKKRALIQGDWETLRRLAENNQKSEEPVG